MKTLKFKAPIRFEVLEVVVYPEICHLVGRFLTGKFRNERRLRVKLDDRWHGVKNHVIELPGYELREVESACGRMGRNSFYRPVYTGKIYVMPLEASAFKFDEVKVLAYRSELQDEIFTWRGYLRNRYR